MTALTVLQIHNRYRQGGGEDTVVEKEAALLRKAGHTVIEHNTVNPSGTIPAATSLLAAPWNPRAAARLGAVVRDARPDVAHVHNTWWALTPSILAALDRLKVPTVVTLHNYRLMCVNAQLFRDGAPCEDCVGTHPWRGVAHRCYRGSVSASTVAAVTIQTNRWLRTWQRVDRLLVLTDFARSRFVDSGIPANRLWVKPNFVDDPGSRTGPPSSSRMVLFVGRLSHEKGIRALLDAWSAAETGDLELVVVGDGPLQTSIESQAIAGVRLVGRLTGQEVQGLMLSARALVFPSIWYEGQPMVLLEALAAGLALVVSDIGGVPETVGGNSAAVQARPGDRESWEVALTGLSDDTGVDRSGEAARRAFEERYSAQIGLDGLIHHYTEAIAHRQGMAR